MCDMTGVDFYNHLVPFAASAGLCLSFSLAAQYEIGRFRTTQKLNRRMNVVITGGTKGIGKALAREFLSSGDRVFLASRDSEAVELARKDLAAQTGRGLDSILGASCDVSDYEDVVNLGDEAQRGMGRIDIWINNAGASGSFKSFLDSDAESIRRVVHTNLLGTMHGTKVAMSLFRKQGQGGHVFNMDGAGYDGNATPNYAAYGATKAAITQMNRSLRKEASARVGVHTLSPGMVLTDLLLEGSTAENRKAFNILCEMPETVASNLVPRVRYAAVKGSSGDQVRYLTLRRALGFLVNWHKRNGRFFDRSGDRTYSSEKERLTPARSAERELMTALTALQQRNQIAKTVDRLANLYSMCFIGIYLVLAEIATAQSIY
ncbi:short-chain dehydrogenase/reductase [Chloropicon primus]|uniref:Short-chain dehydrogenase/reductase n=1 Tax=Chloropicon primus TaxID=1764295 RepID=A0A5B8MX43_9CHLO|nr:short-chain dehydrogenase/reductase [Chloropicon primus]UPR03452.1 short-chain dehydrogenase/reductase [Chloropicon primus]|eukprot:QDZ24245.1 short-chain dehydrogenase/reductase [Chloropicon primus]